MTGQAKQDLLAALRDTQEDRLATLLHAQQDPQVLLESLGIYREELHVQNEELQHRERESRSLAERFAALFEHLPLPAFEFSPSGLVIHANEAARECFDSLALRGGTALLLRLVAPPSQALLQVAYQAAMETGLAHTSTLMLNASLTQVEYGRFVLCQLPANAHGSHNIVGLVIDETESRRVQDALSRSASVFENMHEAVLVLDGDHHIVEANPAFFRMSGFLGDARMGKSIADIHPEWLDAACFQLIDAGLAQSGSWSGEMTTRRADGSIYPVLASFSAVRDTERRLLQYIVIFTDITLIKQHERELEEIATHDALTGLPNRRLLEDRLNLAIARAKRQRSRLAVCFIDLDGFKEINDQFGHRAGDQMLMDVSNQLLKAVRGDDTVARLGGDEFVVLLNEFDADSMQAGSLVRLLQAASGTMGTPSNRLEVTASIGVTVFPDDEVDGDVLLRHADQAMYQAKQQGKSRYYYFDLQGDSAAQIKQQTLTELARALANHELCLHYQPQIRLHDKQLVGVEALVRWQHPQRGLLGPGAFLHELLGSSLEQPFGEWVIASALAQQADWHAEGIALRMSINVSAGHLLTDDFARRLAMLVGKQSRMEGPDVHLEIVESVALADLGMAATTLSHCRQSGVCFALDDFGTGYSSLSYLRALKVESIKIDQSFVRDMLSDVEAFAIVEGIIKLAHAFGREVIAEGVETPEQSQALSSLGCDLAQGFGISVAIPGDSLPYWALAWQDSFSSSTPMDCQPVN